MAVLYASVLWRLSPPTAVAVMELDGGVVRYRAHHYLQEFDLEACRFECGPGGSLIVSDAVESVRLRVGDDVDWVWEALTSAQNSWVQHRGGSMPETEQAKLAGLRATHDEA